MSSIKSSTDDLGESWVNVTAGGSLCGSQGSTPRSITQTISVEDYLRLLKEAQESNHSSPLSLAGSAQESNQSSPFFLIGSARDSYVGSTAGSLVGSARDSQRSSPKSPPNSPVQSPVLNLDWQNYYINSDKEDSSDWSSRPDQLPPKNWSFRPHNRHLSIRYARFGKHSIFSRIGLCTLFLTNLVSLLLGTGVGLWLSRQGLFVPAIKFR